MDTSNLLAEVNPLDYGSAAAAIAMALIFVAYIHKRDLALTNLITEITEIVRENSKFIGEVGGVLRDCHERNGAVVSNQDRAHADQTQAHFDHVRAHADRMICQANKKGE